MLENILDQLNITGAVTEKLAEKKTVSILGCVPGQMEHLIREYGRGFDQKLIIAADEPKAMEILENCLAFDRAAVYYPARDPMFYKADVRGNYISEQRIEAVRRIYDRERLTVITCPDAFTDKLRSLDDIKKKSITIRKDDTVDVKELAEKLVELGYENETQVGGHGDFSVRGNIVDVFPFAEDAPYRIDLWGDQVDSIKVFDSESQRSIEEVDEFTVFSGGDKDTIDGGQVGFLDYFDKERTLVIVHEPAALSEAAEPIDLGGFACLYLSLFHGSGGYPKPDSFHKINVKNVQSYNGRFSELVEDLKKYKEEKYNVTICCASEARAERLRGDLTGNKVSANVVVGTIRTGFEYTDLKEVLISEVDIFGQRRSRKKRKKRFEGDPIKAFTDLNVGDYVVHEQHGIGVYCGIERMKTGGIENDYMKIQYANNANLYVLATQFDRVQKYSGKDGAKPKINKLGGKDWVNTKSKARAAVKDIAADLVRLYASRQMKKGHRYGPDTIWQREFEDAFEFDETDDQLRAVADIKGDMESDRIMDRLVCGDVGFGKTEVAIRAAFKAVQEGYQVAFLAPTTILVKQHFENIAARMVNYPVNVRMMSRFVSAKAQKETLAEIKSGKADIVVGTHRLLSKDVEFKNLGLLIIDEEQRFGVAHKEKIKGLRKDVDVLTLSATPIPRTLHMSLSGIRDMSLLTEPPIDRLPIQTYVMEYSEEAIKEAILREVSRGGQVYYVYNRIDNIESICAGIRNMVPSLNVEFAHGRMSAKELEQIMGDYIAGEIDVLVSTTIIESGLDIPNVNTIIVHDADKYGLSQLYQLRGRVGRSNRMAYAFLMYKRDKLLREDAQKRLKAIREFSDLGAGIKIAMKDLEIRGAGNVLGAEQSGHMEAVGYELYCKMLNEAVALLKGEGFEEDYETTIDLKVDAYIPSEYIKNAYEKLNMYKKISYIQDEENADDVRDELADRFGPVPKATENLINVALLKALAHHKYVTEISGVFDMFKISVYRNAKIDPYRIHGFLNEYKGRLKFVAEAAPYFIFRPVKAPKNIAETLKMFSEFFEKMSSIMADEPEKTE